MKSFPAVLLLIFTLACLPVMTGCIAIAAGAAGAGAVMFVKGKLVQNVDYPLKHVHKATLAALKAQDIFVIEDVLNVNDAHIKAEDYSGKEIKIDLEALTGKATSIEIRVGIMGDETVSRRILDDILESL